jgi:hypothetical protein
MIDYDKLRCQRCTRNKKQRQLHRILTFGFTIADLYRREWFGQTGSDISGFSSHRR